MPDATGETTTGYYLMGRGESKAPRRVASTIRMRNGEAAEEEENGSADLRDHITSHSGLSRISVIMLV